MVEGGYARLIGSRDCLLIEASFGQEICVPNRAFTRPQAAQERPAGELLTIDECRVGARVVLSAIGEVDIGSAADLRAAIESAADGVFEVWVDLTGTTFMDSSGVHTLATARRHVAEAGIRLALICPEGPVLRVLTLTGFDQMFEIYADPSSANYAATV